MKVSIIQNCYKVADESSIPELIEIIRTGKYKRYDLQKKIQALQDLYDRGEKKEYDRLKKKLPGFTISGRFIERRASDKIEEYSNLVILDIDALDGKRLMEIKQQSIELEYTMMSFISVSNHGLKIVVQVDTDLENHKIAFDQLHQYYEAVLGVTIDSGSDVSRLCFFSHDPGVYFNQHAETFKVSTTNYPDRIGHNRPETESDLRKRFTRAVNTTMKNEEYVEGNRNNFIYHLANNCNRIGIPQDNAINFILEEYDLNQDEAEKSINSAYSHHPEEHGKMPNYDGLYSDRQHNDPPMFESPVMPAEVFEGLPELIYKACSCFDDPRQRDIILTSALTILSGCFPNVTGLYDQRSTYPNIYSFVVAPAAHGKGVMNFARQLGDMYHKSVKAESQEEYKQYKRELERYLMEQRSRGKGKSLTMEEPDEPKFRIPFIPANTSCSKMLSQLEENGGGGIICETEADTMSNVFKNEWGSYSDVLRKAFHNEKVSYSRKTNNELIEVDTPRLSVLLSGTPNQVFNLIPTSEDGLFSRFIFYIFKNEQVWRSVSPLSNSLNLTSFFDELSKDVFQIVEYLQERKTEIKLSRAQWQHLDDHFAGKLKDTTAFVDDDAASVVKRMGLITYRIAMILTSLRKGETKNNDVQQICTDQDFERCLMMTDTYLEHSLLMYHNLPRQDLLDLSKGSSDKKRIYDSLPNEFKRIEAVHKGKELGLSARTIDAWLQKWKGNKLEYCGHGRYKKRG